MFPRRTYFFADVKTNGIAIESLSIFFCLQNSQKDTDLVKYLISKGANVNGGNTFGVTPLHRCAEFGKSLNKCKFLRLKLNDFRIDLFPAGNVEVAKVLLENNANVNAKVDDNRTPLHDAASKGKR